MAAVRSRTPSSFGQAFAPVMIDGSPTPSAGQPTMVRMQGVPTMPGYRDRPGKWNALIPPLFVFVIEAIKQFVEKS